MFTTRKSFWSGTVSLGSISWTGNRSEPPPRQADSSLPTLSCYGSFSLVSSPSEPLSSPTHTNTHTHTQTQVYSLLSPVTGHSLSLVPSPRGLSSPIRRKTTKDVIKNCSVNNCSVRLFFPFNRLSCSEASTLNSFPINCMHVHFKITGNLNEHCRLSVHPVP